MPGVNESFRRHVLRLLLPETRAEAVLPPSQPLQIASTRVAFTRRKRGRGSSLQGCTDRRVAPGIRRTRAAAAGAGDERLSTVRQVPVDVAPAAHTAPSQGRRRRPTRSGELPGPWARSPTSLRPVGPEPHYRHGGLKLAKLLSTASGTLVPASRGGPESDRFSRRLGPASLATRGGPESDRSLRRLGPESLASRVGPESDRYQQAPGARVPRHRGGPEPARNPRDSATTPPQHAGPGPTAADGLRGSGNRDPPSESDRCPRH
jgi:hypothetical protein